MPPPARYFSNARPLMPRLLAVVSCAIALLAAQPVATASPARRATAVSVTHSPTIAPRHETTAELAPLKSAGSAQSISLFSSARQFHILATVEILKRLLTSEMAPSARQFLDPVIFAEPLCLGVVCDLPATEHIKAWENFHVILPERLFAIAHCLLAPPVL